MWTPTRSSQLARLARYHSGSVMVRPCAQVADQESRCRATAGGGRFPSRTWRTVRNWAFSAPLRGSMRLANPSAPLECETESKDAVQCSVGRPRHHGAEEIQQRVMQQIEPEGCSGEPANQPFEPSCWHRELHIGKTNDKKRDKGTKDEIIP